MSALLMLCEESNGALRLLMLCERSEGALRLLGRSHADACMIDDPHDVHVLCSLIAARCGEIVLTDFSFCVSWASPSAESLCLL